MKQSLLLLLAAVVLVTASCTEKPRPPPPDLDESHVLSIEGTTLRYNGRVIPWDKPPEAWQELLGPRSRVHGRGISVWDDLGVFLYDNDYKDRTEEYQVACFSVLLGRTRYATARKSEYAFWPKKTFNGRLMVDGALIHKGSTLDEINRTKKGTPFRLGWRHNLYFYDLNGFYIRLDFGHDGTLTEFSISPPMPSDSSDDPQ